MIFLCLVFIGGQAFAGLIPDSVKQDFEKNKDDFLKVIEDVQVRNIVGKMLDKYYSYLSETEVLNTFEMDMDFSGNSNMGMEKTNASGNLKLWMNKEGEKFRADIDATWSGQPIKYQLVSDGKTLFVIDNASRTYFTFDMTDLKERTESFADRQEEMEEMMKNMPDYEETESEIIENPPKVTYQGTEQTPRGKAHLIDIESTEAGTNEKMTVSVIDGTWDPYKLMVKSPEGEGEATINKLELNKSISTSVYDVNKSSLTEIPNPLQMYLQMFAPKEGEQPAFPGMNPY
jgi:hypothetical protein